MSCKETEATATSIQVDLKNMTAQVYFERKSEIGSLVVGNVEIKIDSTDMTIKEMTERGLSSI